MKRYEILLMDADETLLDFRRSEGYALETELKNVGVTMTSAIHDTYHEINRVLWQQLERGDITRDRLKVVRFEQLFAHIGLNGVDAAAFNTAYMQTLSTKGFMLEGAMDCLKALSGRYDVYIITNGSASVQHVRLADSGMLPFVKGVFISEEVGADKPSAVFFDRVCEQIGLDDRSKALVIGDSLTSDMLGGIRSGFDTCWYSPTAQTTDLPVTYTVDSYEKLLALLL